MIKCIVGLKGSGKTKQLIQLVNEAAHAEHGSVICIEKDPKLTYDINHKCRLIDTDQYDISGFEGFYGFLCGLYSQNYDITAMFIDSLYKITGSDNAAEAEAFMVKLKKFSDKTGINFTVTVSSAPETLPAGILKYIG